MTQQRALYPLLVIATTVLALAFAWIGWLDSDDKNHLVGAFGWYEHFPYVGETHAALRHTIAFPVGMSFRLFGVYEWSLIIPNIIQYLALVWMTFVLLRRYFDEKVATTACLLMATLPLFPVFASVVFTEITELFWVAMSFWLFHEAAHRDRRLWWLLGAGAAAGCGWLTRETTAALLLAYGVLFLAGFGIARREYWIMAIGFFVIVGAEAIYMAILTGDPLYRYQVVINKQGDIPYKGGLDGDVFNRIGNVSVNPLLDPFLVLFANHEFALLFYVAIPAVWWSLRNSHGAQRQTLRALALWGLIWFVFVSAILTNRHQRYYSVCAYVAAIFVAYWLVHGVSRYGRHIAGAALAVLLAANLAALYVDNRNPLFGERALLEFSGNTQELVYTDSITARRSLFFLNIAGRSEQVRGALPPAGVLFFVNPNRKRNWTGKNAYWNDFKPDPSWEVVWTKTEPRKWTGIILEGLELDELLPASIYRRLNIPNHTVTVYRTNSQGAAATAAQ